MASSRKSRILKLPELRVLRGKTGFLVVLVTTPNKRVSDKLSRLLLERCLAACVNRVPGLRSRYWWKGRIETAREELLIIKTSQDRLRALVETVRRAHPYEVCEILALKTAGGNPSYLKWLNSCLRQPSK